MSEAWYVDSLDAAGGLAFASWRLRDDNEESAYADSSNTYFIGPPFFVPEPAPRALALSARRGSFQTGFYLGNEEHPFEALSHVVEFVRRAYLGNDGLDGTPNVGSGPPPPRPEGDDGRADIEFDGGPLADAFSQFAKLPVSDGSAAECDWIAWLDLEYVTRPVRRLNDLAHHTLGSVAMELIARSSDSTPEMAARTMRSWSAFCVVGRCVLPIEREFYRFLDDLRLNSGTGFYWYGPSGDDASSRFANPHEALAHLPLPRWLSNKLKAGGSRNVDTIAQLLSLVASSPTNIVQNDYAAVADIVLLAAAAIISPETLGSHGSAGLGLPQAPDVAEGAMRRLMENALRWCSSSLPVLKFDDRVEKAIQDTTRLRTDLTPQSSSSTAEFAQRYNPPSYGASATS